MPLSQEQINAMSQATGLKYSNASTTGIPSLADKIRALKPKEAPIVEAGKRTVETFKELGSDVKDAFSAVPNRALEGSIDPKTGKSTVIRSLIAAPAAAGEALGKTAGAIARGAGALIATPFDAVITSLKREKPEQIEAIKNSPGYKNLQEAFKEENINPDVKKVFDKLSEKAQENPEIAQSLKDAFEVVMLGGAGQAEKQLVDKGKKVFNTVSEAIPTPALKAPAVFENAIEDAKKILNPSQKYTPTEVEKLRQRGEIKVEGSGPFRKEVADPRTTSTHETLASLVEEGKISSKNLPSENAKIIKQEARINDSNIDEIVNRPELNKPFTKSTINKVFDSVENSAKKDLIFVEQSTEEKIYKAVMEVAKDEIGKNSLNSAGLRKSIKAFNARMEEILGKDIYAGSSESVGNARLQAAKDIRHALSDFLADNLESAPIKIDKNLANTKVVNKLPSKSQYELGKTKGGEVYRSQLQREAQLLNAADEIAYRTRGSLNKTEIKKWLDAHPKIKKTLGLGATALGGAGVYNLATGN